MTNPSQPHHTATAQSNYWNMAHKQRDIDPWQHNIANFCNDDRCGFSNYPRVFLEALAQLNYCHVNLWQHFLSNLNLALKQTTYRKLWPSITANIPGSYNSGKLTLIMVSEYAIYSPHISADWQGIKSCRIKSATSVADKDRCIFVLFMLPAAHRKTCVNEHRCSFTLKIKWKCMLQPAAYENGDLRQLYQLQ